VTNHGAARNPGGPDAAMIGAENQFIGAQTQVFAHHL
jgi:hypothetical protein